MKLQPSKIAFNIILPVVSASLLVFAIANVERPSAQTATPAVQPPAASPSLSPTAAALGVVEPSSEAIAVAVDTPGVVRQLLVEPGSDVVVGQPLLRLDTRAVDAELRKARAALAVAEVAAADAAARASLFADVSDARAISGDEADRAGFAARRAIAEVELARAEVRRLETERDRLVVRAPIAGRVLRVNVRVGEYAPVAGSLPLLVLGAVDVLHVRAQIDEEDFARGLAGNSAEGSLRGDGSARIPLTFVRFEPQAQPKRNLNGGAERVDTRVIEAIYAFDGRGRQVFVGQQMDVFIGNQSPATRGGSR